MKKLLNSINKISLLIIILLVGTIITSILLLILPFSFRSDTQSEMIKTEMIKRIEDIAEQRDQLSFISFTPFMWDEGYLLNETVNMEIFDRTTIKNIEYRRLSENEQRFIFYYKGQQIIDLVIDKDEINFDITPGQLKKNEWINIDDSYDVIRLYE